MVVAATARLSTIAILSPLSNPTHDLLILPPHPASIQTASPVSATTTPLPLPLLQFAEAAGTKATLVNRTPAESPSPGSGEVEAVEAVAVLVAAMGVGEVEGMEVVMVVVVVVGGRVRATIGWRCGVSSACRLSSAAYAACGEAATTRTTMRRTTAERVEVDQQQQSRGMDGGREGRRIGRTSMTMLRRSNES